MALGLDSCREQYPLSRLRAPVTVHLPCTPLARGADDGSVLPPSSAPSTAMPCACPRLESRGGQTAHGVHLRLLVTPALLRVIAMPSCDIRREQRSCRILAWEMSDSVGHPMTVEVRVRVRRAPYPRQG